MAIPVFGFGAGGHAKVVMEILQLDGRYEVVGLLDPAPALRGREVLGVPVLGGDDQVEAIKACGAELFFVGVGSAPDLTVRIRVYQSALEGGLSPVEAPSRGRLRWGVVPP